MTEPADYDAARNSSAGLFVDTNCLNIRRIEKDEARQPTTYGAPYRPKAWSWL